MTVKEAVSSCQHVRPWLVVRGREGPGMLGVVGKC